MKVLVLGASTNPARYSHMAGLRLQAKGHETILVGQKNGKIGEVDIHQTTDGINDVDTITLYLNPTNQEAFRHFIKTAKPRRVIFNPGTENPEFMEELNADGIDAFEACTLVMLGTGQF